MNEKSKLALTFLLAILMISSVHAQTDLKRWEAESVSYEIPYKTHHIYSIDNSSFGMMFFSFARNVYYFFISDLDGDNCPFYPTCSSFFVESVKETNILKGTLMFADRFTRDINFFKGRSHYPVYLNGKLFDPPSNYTMDSQKIKF